MNKYGINDWRNEVLRSSLTPLTKLVGMGLAMYYRDGEACFPSITTLQMELGVSRPTIVKAIGELEKNGFIEIQRGVIAKLSITSNCYLFCGVDKTDGKNTGKSDGKINGKINGKSDGKPDLPEEDNKYNTGISEEDIQTSSRCSDVGTDALHPQGKFKKPTPEEVEAYCRERENGVDAERFWNFYEAKGWKVGKNPMKDWRAAVRTWEREEIRKPAPSVSSDGGLSVWDKMVAIAEAEQRMKGGVA